MNNKVMSDNIPWTEKYRPTKIENIISHTEIINSLNKFIKMKTLPHLLFFGPSGSGKTSTILCCANEIYGSYASCMVMQLNASNDRGIDTVRNNITNFVSNQTSIFLPLDMRKLFKLVILDEIDSMTFEAQGMLRQLIETHSHTTRFCLICNDIDKINIALQSRCALFRFSPLNHLEIETRLIEICKIENIKFTKDSIVAIIKICKGDMRSAINILQHVNMVSGNKKILEEYVYQISGYCMPEVIVKIFEILMKVSKNKMKIKEAYLIIQEMIIEHNITLYNFIDELKNIILASEIDLNKKIDLIINLAAVEVYNSVNVDNKNLIMIIVGLFIFN